MFWKNKLTTEFVELTIGRVYFTEIDHGTLNRITRKSTIFGRTLNNNMFLELFEYAIVDLSKRKLKKLSLHDGNKLRAKLKEILLRHGIIEAEAKKEVLGDTANIFSKADVEWFGKAKKQGLNKVMSNG